MSSLLAITTNMASKTYRVLTWNVNGLRTRFPDLHSYVITHRPDIIALQEVGPEVPPLTGYVSHVLGCNDGSGRGLAMFLKCGLPITLKDKGKCNGTEFIVVALYTQSDVILFANLYVHAGAFHVADIPDCVLEEKCI